MSCITTALATSPQQLTIGQIRRRHKEGTKEGEGTKKLVLLLLSFFESKYLTQEHADKECLVHRTRNSRDSFKVRAIPLDTL